MGISAGLDWAGNLGPQASAAAADVDRLIASLRALQSVGGARGGAAPAIPGVGEPGTIGALGAAARRAAAIQGKSAADLAKVEAQRLATLDAINAKTSGNVASVKAKGELSAQNAQQQQALVAAKAAAALAATQNKAEAARLATQNAIVKNQAKAADDAHLAMVRGAEEAKRAAEAIALAEVQGAQKANEIRLKAAADIAKIQAKSAADTAKAQAKEATKASKASAALALKLPKGARVAGPRSVSEATTSGIGGAAKAILEGKGLKGAVGSFGGRAAKVAAVGSFIFDVASQTIGVLGDVSKRFGTAVVEAQAYREDLSEAFTVVARSAKDGNAVMNRALATADKLGAGRAETTGQFLDLLTKGFDTDTIERIIGSLRDLSTIDPSASMEGLTKVIGKVQATGRLNQETLNELSTFGLEQSDVIKQIGAQLKKSDAEVLRALSSSGGIRGLGVEPILQAINAQVGGGVAGEKATAKAKRNLSSLIKRVQEIPDNILFDVDAGSGLDNVKTILREVLSFFAAGSATAKSASKAIGDAFSALVAGLAGTNAKDTGASITADLATLVQLLKDATPAINAFGLGINLAFKFASGFFGMIGSGFGLLQDFGTWLGTSEVSVSTWFSGLGTNIIDGITGGITGGAQRVIDSVTSVASGALKSAKSVLGIASPSKEFARIGGWSAEGMAIGFEREALGVTNAARVMSEDAALAASMQMPALLPGTSARSAGMQQGAAPKSNVFNINIVVQAGPGTNAVAIADQIEEPMRIVFSRIMREQL